MSGVKQLETAGLFTRNYGTALKLNVIQVRLAIVSSYDTIRNICKSFRALKNTNSSQYIHVRSFNVTDVNLHETPGIARWQALHANWGQIVNNVAM